MKKITEFNKIQTSLIESLEKNQKVTVKKFDLKTIKSFEEKNTDSSLKKIDLDEKKVKKSFVLSPVITSALNQEKDNLKKQEEAVRIQVELLSQEAIQKGYKDGYHEGLLEGKKEIIHENLEKFKNYFEEMNHFLQEVVRVKSLIYEQNEEFLINFLFKLVKIIIFREINLDKKLISDIIKKIISNLESKDFFKINLSQKQCDFIETLKQELKLSFKDESRFTIECLDRLSSGECEIETSWSLIQVNLIEQLELFEKSLVQHSRAG